MMILFLAASFFVFGAIIASFIGVVVGRMYTGASFVRGRSVCDSCGRTLSALDLVPILSFCAYRGRARCCGARIGAASTLAELLLGALFALSYWQLGLTFALAVFLIALAALAALVLYDLRHMIIPPSFLALFLIASLGFAVLEAPNLAALEMTALVALGEGLFLAALHYGSRGRAMGLADAPLACALGLLSGPAAISGFILSFWIGALVGITILVRTPKGARMGIEVPFAPFLAAGFLLAYFTQWNVFTFIANLMMRAFGA